MFISWRPAEIEAVLSMMLLPADWLTVSAELVESFGAAMIGEVSATGAEDGWGILDGADPEET